MLDFTFFNADHQNFTEKEFDFKSQINLTLNLVILFSQVTASGPKGLVKGDVMKYILANNLKPVAAKVAEPAAPAKPAPVKAEKPAVKPAVKPQYQVR